MPARASGAPSTTISPSGTCGSDGAEAAQADGEQGAEQHRPERCPEGRRRQRIREGADPGSEEKGPGDRDGRECHRQPGPGEPGRRRGPRVRRNGQPQSVQEMQHEERAARPGQRREQAHDALAEQWLDCQLRHVAARKRKPAEAQRQHRRRQQHRPKAARAARRGHAHREEQGALGEDMVRRIEGHRHGRAAVARGQRHAQHGGDETHLAHARIGEHGLRIGLRDADRDAVEGRDKSRRGQGCAPVWQRGVEGQEAEQPDDARLADRAADDRRSRNRRRRIGERQPDVQRHEPDLEPEAHDQKGEGRVAPGRCRQHRHGIADREAAARGGRRQQRKGHQQGNLGEHREAEVDDAGPERAGRALVDHEAPGGKADHGEGDIEADQVGGDEHAEAAGQRQQPPLREAAGSRPDTDVGPGVDAGDAPEQRRDPEQDRPWRIERERELPPRLVQHQGRAVGRQQRRRQSRQRRQAQERRHGLPDAPRQAGEQHADRHRHRGDEQQTGAAHA